MKKERKQNKKEEGITLLALVITVMLLIILAAIAIRSIAGNGGLIETTLTAKEQHTIEVYRGALEEISEKTIVGNNVKGKDTTVTEIAKEMEKEEWVKKAEPNEEDHDIYVVTKEGYVYQLYYNGIYGKLEIEYVDKETKDPAPNLKAWYEQNLASILGRAWVSEGKIAKLELIYRKEIKETRENPKEEERYKVEEIGTGWYKIRATTDKGRKRIKWVYVSNVSDKLVPPDIKVDKEPNEAGWYKDADMPVTITLSGGTGKIRYRIVGKIEAEKEENDNYYEEEGTDYTEPIKLDETGLRTIYAWTTDGKYKSADNIQKIRIDRNKPELDEPKITQVNGKAAVKVKESNWYTSDVNIEISGRDQTSEPIHYEYKLIGKNETWVSKELGEKIEITDEGTTEVAIRTVDLAGNTSDEKAKTIKIDRIAPTFSGSNITIGKITSSTANFTAVATDDGSGKEGGLTYKATITSIDGTDSQTATSANGSFTITGLKKKSTTYQITITATDPCGHESQSITGSITTKGELKAPTVTPVAKNSSDAKPGGWTKGPVKITIQDTAPEEDTAAEYAYSKIINKTTAQEETGGPLKLTNQKAEIEYSKNGEYEIKAWIQDGNTDQSKKGPEGTNSYKIDSIGPTFNPTTISTTGLTATTVNFTVTATDNLTGKTGGITYTAKIKNTAGAVIKTATTTNGTFAITGLTKQTTYKIEITATDPLGNPSTNTATGNITTKGELKAPRITPTAKAGVQTGTNGWIKGTVTIEIADTAPLSDTAAVYAYYKITNNATKAVVKTGGPLTLTGQKTTIEYNANGQYTITAWVQDGNTSTSKKSPEGTNTFKIDTDLPASAAIEMGTGNRGPAPVEATNIYYYNTKATIVVKPRTDATS